MNMQLVNYELAESDLISIHIRCSFEGKLNQKDYNYSTT